MDSSHRPRCPSLYPETASATGYSSNTAAVACVCACDVVLLRSVSSKAAEEGALLCAFALSPGRGHAERMCVRLAPASLVPVSLSLSLSVRVYVHVHDTNFVLLVWLPLFLEITLCSSVHSWFSTTLFRFCSPSYCTPSLSPHHHHHHYFRGP